MTIDPVADNGYFAGSEILIYHRAGITTTLPRPEIKEQLHVREGQLLYEPKRDVYRCPAETN